MKALLVLIISGILLQGCNSSGGSSSEPAPAAPPPPPQKHLSFENQPDSAISFGSKLNRQPKIGIFDESNQIIYNQDCAIKLTLYKDPNCTQSLGLSYSQDSVGGHAQFNNITMSQAGSFYFKAEYSTFTSACSSLIKVTSRLSLSAISNQSFESGVSGIIQVSSADPDSNNVSYSFSGNQSMPGATISSNGVFSWNPDTTLSGNNYLVTVVAQDDVNGYSVKTFNLSVVPHLVLSQNSFMEGEVKPSIFTLSITGKEVSSIQSNILTDYFSFTSIRISDSSGPIQTITNKDLTSNLFNIKKNQDFASLSFTGAVKVAKSGSVDFTVKFSDNTTFTYNKTVNIVSAGLPYFRYDIYSIDSYSNVGVDPDVLYNQIFELKRTYSGWRTPIFVRYRESEIYCSGTMLGPVVEANDNPTQQCVAPYVSTDAETAFYVPSLKNNGFSVGGAANGIRGGVYINRYSPTYDLAHELGHNLGLWHTFENGWNPLVNQSDADGFFSRYVYAAVSRHDLDNLFLGGWVNYRIESINGFRQGPSFDFSSTVKDLPLDPYAAKIETLYDPDEKCTAPGNCTYPNGQFRNGDILIIAAAAQNADSVCKQSNIYNNDYSLVCDNRVSIPGSLEVVNNVMSYWQKQTNASKFSNGQKQRMDLVLANYPQLTSSP